MYEDKEYKAPGQESLPERGYFICLPTREDIAREVPRFMEEVNLGQNLEDDLGFPGGLLAALGGPMGGPNGGIVLPMGPMPQPPAQAAAGAPPAPGAPPPQTGNAGQPAAAGAQGGGNALNAALNQLLAGGPPQGHHHHTFTIPLPAFGPFPSAPNGPQAAPVAAATNNAAAATAPGPAPAPATAAEPADDGQWMDEGEVWVDDVD